MFWTASGLHLRRMRPVEDYSGRTEPVVMPFRPSSAVTWFAAADPDICSCMACAVMAKPMSEY